MMRWKRIGMGLVVVALLCVLGASNYAQIDPTTGGIYAELHGRTDDDGKLTIKCEFPGIMLGITGTMRDALEGEVLRNLPTKIYLEPRPEIAEIMGIGNIGALWVSLWGYEWKRVTEFGLGWTASGPEIDLGEVALRPKLTVGCEETRREVWVFGPAGDQHQTIVFGTCTAELTFEFDPTQGLRHAKRVSELPKAVARFCTWIVVEKVEPHQVTKTTYHSDGRVWIEKDKEVLKRVPSLPATARDMEKFIVKGAGGKEYEYWWWQPNPEEPGKWFHMHGWTPPVEVTTPEEEPPEPGEPGQPGEPGAG